MFLGRPWREEARTVFLDCEMDYTIAPERFSGWGGITKDEPETFYGEFGTKIAGGESGSAAPVADAATENSFDNSRKNSWVKDIDAALAAELSARADEVVKAVCC